MGEVPGKPRASARARRTDLDTHTPYPKHPPQVHQHRQHETRPPQNPPNPKQHQTLNNRYELLHKLNKTVADEAGGRESVRWLAHCKALGENFCIKVV